MSDANSSWLFMMYMVAGDDDRLDTLAVQDLREIESGVQADGNVQALVQIHRRWPDEPQRYRITKERGTELVEFDLKEEAVSAAALLQQGVNRRGSQKGAARGVLDDGNPLGMGDSAVLAGFLLSALSLDGVDTDTNFALVLWGHSAGLGLGRNHNDKLTLIELRRALATFNLQRQARLQEATDGRAPSSGRSQDAHQEIPTPRTLELLGGNTCVLSYAEAIYQVRDCAQYLVASEVFVPFAGWPYDRILAKAGNKGPKEMGRHIVAEYAAFYDQPDRDERVAMTLVDLSQARPLASRIQDLADGIGRVITTDSGKSQNALARVQDAFLANPAGMIRPVLDLGALANDLRSVVEELGGTKQNKELKDLDDAADAIQGLIRELVIAPTFTQPFENLSGVGIFAPFVTDDGNLGRLHEVSRRCDGDMDNDLKSLAAALDHYKDLEVFDADQIRDSKRALLKRAPKGYVVDAATLPRREALWTTLVISRLGSLSPPDIVDASGAVKRTDRVGVQLLRRAVDAAFRRLSRTIRESRTELRAHLTSWGQMENPRHLQLRLQLLKRLGPPSLRLTSLAALLTRSKLAGGLASPTADAPPHPRSNGVASDASAFIQTLKQVEDRLSQAEHTARRVVTDGDLGVGPSAGPDGGAVGLQKEHGGGLQKEHGGGLQKEHGGGLQKEHGGGLQKEHGAGLGDPTLDGALRDASLGSKIAFVSADPAFGSIATIELLGHVAHVLERLEGDVSGIEGALADLLLNQDVYSIMSSADFAAAAAEEFDNLFVRLEHSAEEAHATIRSVLQHPTFGLGPGPAGIGRRERERLASAAGLSPNRLRLLTASPPGLVR